MGFDSNSVLQFHQAARHGRLPLSTLRMDSGTDALASLLAHGTSEVFEDLSGNNHSEVTQYPHLMLPPQNARLPAVLCCPITGHLYDDPIVASDGETYERKAWEERFAQQVRFQPVGRSSSLGYVCCLTFGYLSGFVFTHSITLAADSGCQPSHACSCEGLQGAPGKGGSHAR